MKEWREIDGFPNRGPAIKNILRSCKNNNATAYSYKWKLKTL